MMAFNLIRYILSLLLLVGGAAAGFIVGPILGVITILVLLYVNNCIDDAAFYQGSRHILSHKYRGGVACPVNGVVTCIESNVPLMGHIRKCDYLDGDILLELKHHEDRSRYNHATIFLNKLNGHAVTNIGSPIVQQREYTKDGQEIEMVEDGDLISSIDGRFLSNSFIRTNYANGVICIYTLDKYVSKMIPSGIRELLGVDYFICRGSQCDIYIPTEMAFCVRQNQILFNLQTICEGEKLSVPGGYASKVGSLIHADPCARAGYILWTNLKKTISTFGFSNRVILAILLTAICWSGIYPTVAGSYPLVVVAVVTGLFALDRFVKNLCYSIFNISGLKPALAAYYRRLHRFIGWK